MATHIVAWNFKPEVKEEDKEALKANMKKNLESLVGRVPGLLEVRFVDNASEGSNREIGLITKHATFEDIAGYSNNPEHVAVASTFVRPYTADRICLNFE